VITITLMHVLGSQASQQRLECRPRGKVASSRKPFGTLNSPGRALWVVIADEGPGAFYKVRALEIASQTMALVQLKISANRVLLPVPLFVNLKSQKRCFLYTVDLEKCRGRMCARKDLSR
jgi:hypothetical protein